MSEYKGIKGFQVQTRTEDPVPYAQALADNPYSGAWASGANLNTGRGDSWAGAGTQTSALGFGGFVPPGAGHKALTEQWDGSSWTEVNDLNTARGSGIGGAGANSTAALAFGGYQNSGPYIAVTESWNGSSWTEVNDLNTSRGYVASSQAAPYTACLAFGGYTGTANTADTEQWDGTSWTEVNNLNTARRKQRGAGTSSTAALAIGGTPPDVAITESWNGSTWTEVGDLNTARGSMFSGGTSTSAQIAGGEPAKAVSESWNGSAWTEVNNLGTGRAGGASSGSTGTATLAFGGDPASQATELWSFSGLDPSTTPAADYSNAISGDFYYNSTTGQFKTVNDGGAPIGTWASGASTNTEAGQRGGASRSSTSDAFVSGGFDAGAPAVTANAESYNGSAWTEGPNQPGTNRIGASWGATNSYVNAGGSVGTSGAPINPYAFEWNGSSFSNGGQLNNARRNAAGAGVSESAGRVMAGGDNPGPAQAFNESYNGTAFTEETDLNTARIRPIGFGTLTAAIAASGGSGTNVESWDGSSWTEIAEVVSATSNSAGGAGTSTDGLIFTAKASPSNATTCQFWNGTSWAEVADLSVNRYANVGGGANSTNAISVGGYGPPSGVATSTEEWTAADFTIKTVTTS